MRVPIFCNDYVLLRIYGCGGVFYDIQTRQALSRLLNKSTSVAYNFVITKKTFFQFPVLPLCQCLTLCFPVQRLCPCLTLHMFPCAASVPVFNPMFPCAASVPVIMFPCAASVPLFNPLLPTS